MGCGPALTVIPKAYVVSDELPSVATLSGYGISIAAMHVAVGR
jgi:hypothetical protein